MYIIAGLGNPGRKYINTKHNIGFDVVDYLAKKHNIKINGIKFKGNIGKGEISGRKVLLLKPATYMNLSGISILDAVKYYGVSNENLLVIYDDADLDIGKLRLRKGGSSGTHNGMKSVIYQLQTEDFPRLRLGIGSPPGDGDLARYVLNRFSSEQRDIIDEAIKKSVLAVETFLKEGINRAMDKFNG